MWARYWPISNGHDYGVLDEQTLHVCESPLRSRFFCGHSGLCKLSIHTGPTKGRSQLRHS
jgi:hypothetical protein